MPPPEFLLKLIPPKRFLFTGTLSLVTLVLFSVILGACTGPSPGIPTLYIFRIIDKDFEVRAGYFGTCLGTSGRLVCSAKAGEYGSYNDAPVSHREYVKMVMDARHTVFIPFIEAVAAGFFFIALPCMFYAQVTTTVTKTTAHIDKAVIYLFGLASFVSLLATVGLTYGRQGIVLAAGNWSDGATVDVGNPMLTVHAAVCAFCLILFVVNWSATLEGSFGKGGGWLFARNGGSGDKF
jgi:hypothetical protein